MNLNESTRWPILSEEQLTTCAQQTVESSRPLKRQDLSSMVPMKYSTYWLSTILLGRNASNLSTDALGRNISKAVSGELTSQQSINEDAKEWVKIVQKLGIDNKSDITRNFLAGARNSVIKSVHPSFQCPKVH